MNDHTLILLSGGLDSAANLALAYEEHRALTVLHVDYGQRAEPAERRASEWFASYYEANFLSLDLRWLGVLGGSSLTDSSRTVPELNTSELDDREVTEKSASAVWVPNRNGVLIQTAAAIAERNAIRFILVGFNAEEAATFPDNTADFMRCSTAALALSTKNRVQVECYTTELSKREIVGKLRALSRKPFPFDQVWSCYHSGFKICGQCESCRRFIRATVEG